MPVIKRYPNRKLYDTAAKQYISLDGIAGMIRRGETVKVVDHTTGEDLTTLVLVQIIAEQEKQHTGFLPLAVLTGLVQAGGNTLASLRRSLSVPLDLLRQVDEEIEERVEKLVALGELAEDEGRRLIQKLVELGGPSSERQALTEMQVEAALRARALPTREDLQKLGDLLDRLSAEVDDLRQASDRSPAEAE